MTRISFLMPTFNRAHLIAESIASVTAQMAADDELIIIDDGSTDDTQAVLDKIDAEIRRHRQENSGKSAALNRAMRLAQGRFIWICDDDDLLCPGAVATLTDRIEESGADFVFGRYTRFRTENGRRVDLGTGYWPDLSQGSLTRHILEDSFVMHNASLVRREAYERVGPFDETMLRSLDYDMFVRLATRTRCAFADAIIFAQRKHEGARGPARVRHAAGRSDDVWKRFDQAIFKRLRSEVELGFFMTMFESRQPDLVRRAALLQRAAIMARHDLWEFAADDLTAAAAIDDSPLTALERDICRRTVAGKHGFAGALAPDVLGRLKALDSRPGPARAIVREMMDGLIWRFRQPEAGPKRDALKMIGNIAGLQGFAAISWRRLARGNRRDRQQQGPQITERREVPPLPPR